jgi:hypothetical protein
MWATGDPGLLFVDNMLKYSPLKAEDEPRFSNPCGEYLASAGSACNLITVNAARLAREVFDELEAGGGPPGAAKKPTATSSAAVSGAAWPRPRAWPAFWATWS